MEIMVNGDYKRIEKAVINKENTNPLGCWKELGSPVYPDKAELAQINAASELKWIIAKPEELKFHMEKESVTIFRLTK